MLEFRARFGEVISLKSFQSLKIGVIVQRKSPTIEVLSRDCSLNVSLSNEALI